MTSRLPPKPRLEWKDDGAPRALDADDVYFSADDGLAETRAVFLDGCGLPHAWSGRERFTVGELGFGSGLNILALWDLWRRRRPAENARLQIVSFEGSPMDASEAARAHRVWPELADLSARLVQNWPVRARGVQKIDLSDGVSLTLYIDDVDRALPQANAACDAWFLDGFAPAKNPDMWSEDVLRHVGRMTRAGGRLATYTVAGAVRRGLEAAGFTVSKAPGFGRKRERLEAVKHGAPATRAKRPPQKVVIIGGGVAGAACAHAFHRRGCETVLIEQTAPAAGASGNPRALVMPRLDAADTPTARALIAAYLAALRAYRDLPDGVATPVDVDHFARSEADRARFAKLFADPPLDEDWFEPIDRGDPGAGARHKQAVIINPPALIQHWLSGVSIVTSAVAALTPGAPAHVELADGSTHAADLIVLATGHMAAALLGDDAPPLEGRLGQIEWADAPSEAVFAKAAGDYAIQSGGVFAFGATFEAYGGGPPTTSSEARAQNVAAAMRLHPELDAALLTARLSSRAGVRATTPDRLPLIGAVHDRSIFMARYGAALAHGRSMETAAGPTTNLEGVAIAGGFGSRGFTWAPWAADILAADAFDEPAPAERSVLDAVSPARFLVRALKRNAANV